MCRKFSFRTFFVLPANHYSLVYSLMLLIALYVVNYSFVKVFSLAGTLWWQKSLWNFAIGSFLWYSLILLNLRQTRSISAKHWALPAILILGVGVSMESGIHQWMASFFIHDQERLYVTKLFFRSRFLIIFTLIALVLIVSRNVKFGDLNSVFKRDTKNHRYRFWFLLLIPLVVIAISFPDFQRAYPRYKPWNVQEAFGLSKVLMTVIAEIAYAFDFIMTEWVYRGFFVIVLGRFFGKEVILPAAVLYAVMHFGKPAGEAISSLFGGYLLGIIAYRSGSIRTCISLHLGLAMSMEVAGMIQHYWA